MGLLVGARDRTRSYGTALANTNTTACFTNLGPDPAKGVAVMIGNEAGSTKVVLVYWYDATDAVAYFIYGVSIDDDRSELFDLSGLRLDEADEIRVKADSGVSVVVTVTEYTGP